MVLSFIRLGSLCTAARAAALSVLLGTKDAEQRFRVKVFMQKLICQGRFPIWVVRGGCLRGFSWVGLLEEAVRQIWVVTVETLNRHLGGMETILKQITEMGLQLSSSHVFSGVHLPHAFSAACVTQDYIYKHFIPIPG